MCVTADFKDGVSVCTCSGICIDPNSDFLERDAEEIKETLFEAAIHLENLKNYEQGAQILRERDQLIKRPWVLDDYMYGGVRTLALMADNEYATDEEKADCKLIIVAIRAYQDRKAQKRIANKSLRKQIIFRDRGLCRYCAKQVDKLDQRIDHVIPYSLGGRTEIDNLVLACNSCNSTKSGKTLAECGMALLEIVNE